MSGTLNTDGLSGETLMGRKWWEFGSDDSRLLYLYRRYDAVNHLTSAVTNDSHSDEVTRSELNEIIDEVSSIFPKKSLDFIAQAVMLARAGKIELSAADLHSYLSQLEQYIESDGELGDALDSKIGGGVVATWCRFQGWKSLPIGPRKGQHAGLIVRSGLPGSDQNLPTEGHPFAT
jgi:hypothetical protein